jgi:hypothetical protein
MKLVSKKPSPPPTRHVVLSSSSQKKAIPILTKETANMNGSQKKVESIGSKEMSNGGSINAIKHSSSRTRKNQISGKLETNVTNSQSRSKRGVG